MRTRADVLHAAAECFAEHGFRSTSLKEVADRAELTKGAVYFHFPTKEALAVAVIEEHYSTWPQLLAELAAEDLGPWELAMEMLDRAALAFRDDVAVRAGARLQIERSLIDAPLPEPYVGWVEVLTELLEQARRAGQLQPDVDPAVAARCLVASFFGMQHISDVLHRRADILERWAELQKTFAKAMHA